MDMKLLLRDRILNESGWKNQMRARGLEIDAKGSDGDAPDEQEARIIVFLHHETEENFEWWVNWAEGQPGRYLVHISSNGGTTGDCGDTRRRFNCHWTPTEFGDRQNERTSKFCQQLKDGDITKIEWELLQPACIIPENLAAWALWKEADRLGLLAGKTRPNSLPNDDDELLKDEFRILARSAQSDYIKWDDSDLQPVKELLALAAQRA
jgi:hypothetical protein